MGNALADAAARPCVVRWGKEIGGEPRHRSNFSRTLLRKAQRTERIPSARTAPTPIADSNPSSRKLQERRKQTTIKPNARLPLAYALPINDLCSSVFICVHLWENLLLVPFLLLGCGYAALGSSVVKPLRSPSYRIDFGAFCPAGISVTYFRFSIRRAKSSLAAAGNFGSSNKSSVVQANTLAA